MGRKSAKASIRSTSFTIRSVSSQISRVSAAILVAGVGLEQLRGASDARQRVLDLMRQHRAKRGNRAGGAAVGQLPVYFFSNCPLLQHDRHGIDRLRQRRDKNVDNSATSSARGRYVDLVAVDRCMIIERIGD